MLRPPDAQRRKFSPRSGKVSKPLLSAQVPAPILKSEFTAGRSVMAADRLSVFPGLSQGQPAVRSSSSATAPRPSPRCACCSRRKRRSASSATRPSDELAGSSPRARRRAPRATASGRRISTARCWSSRQAASGSATPRSSPRRASANIPANAVDSPDLCDFYTPAIVNRAPVAVAITSTGAGPVLAQKLRARIEAMLPTRLGALAQPRRFFPRRRRTRAAEGPAAPALLVGLLRRPRRRCGARRPDRRGAPARFAAAHASRRRADSGFVWLVGAGPGAADLLTLRAQRILQEADVIVHDALVPEAVVAMGRRDAERIDVGKRKGHHSASQDEINALLVREAAAGRRVVRLKSGDPLVFGRAGEEMAALRAAGIPFEIVPGVTAALAAAAEAEIPLTLRGTASSLVFATGQDARGDVLPDWAGLALSGATVAVYMGRSVAARVADAADARRGSPLRRRSRSSRTPRCRSGGIFAGTLGDLAALRRPRRYRRPDADPDRAGGRGRRARRRRAARAGPSRSGRLMATPCEDHHRQQPRRRPRRLPDRRRLEPRHRRGRGARDAKEALEAALARANADAAANRVVEPYAIEVTRERRAASCRCGCANKSAPTDRPPAIRRTQHPPPSQTKRPEDTNMYRYDEFDHAFVNERVAQFRDQVGAAADRRARRGPVQAAPAAERRLPAAPRLHAADRRSLRHAQPAPGAACSPTSRATTTRATATSPRGRTCSSTGRALKDVPDILAELADVEMHCIQTSGNCIRNVTADHFAGVAADEVADPRPYAEILRQWSSLHPEFLFLPRKFKIAVTGAPVDRAAIQFHDIGYEVKRNEQGRARLRRLYRRRHGPHADARQEDPRLPARGGPARLFGGDPARLQHARTPRQQVQGAHQDPRPRDAAWRTSARRSRRSSRRTAHGVLRLPEEEVRRIAAYFAPPAYEERPTTSAVARARARSPIRPSTAGSRHNVSRAPRARLRHRHHLAEADRRRAGRRHRRPDGRASPTSPSAIRSTRSASATSRTSSCRMSRRTI